MNQLEVINIADMYPTRQSMDKLYMYEITNRDLSTLQIEESSINFFELSNEKIIYGHFSSNTISMNVTPPSDDQIVRAAEVNYKTSLQFLTNDDLVNSSELHKYVFSKKQFTQEDSDNGFQPEFFILGNENTVIYTPVNNEKMWTLNFIEFKSLEVFKNSRSVFVLEKNLSNKTDVNGIELQFENSALINNIKVIGNLLSVSDSKKIYKNSLIDFNDDSKYFISLFAIPVIKGKNEIQVYTSSFNKNYSLIFKDLIEGINGNDFSVNTELYIGQKYGKKALDLIDDLISVTKVVTSGYSEMSNEEIQSFKETKYSGNNPKEYCDFKIKEFLNSLEDDGQKEDVSRKIKNQILALSEYLSSSYCWKGGLTEEHKIGLPIYMNYDKNKKITISSTYYNLLQNVKNPISPNFENIFKGYLNGNIIKFNNSVINFPNVPSKIEEQNLSNTPLDYNENSYNLNYMCYLFFDSNEMYKNLLFGNIETDKLSSETQRLTYEFTTDIPEITATMTVTQTTSITNGPGIVQQTFISGNKINQVAWEDRNASTRGTAGQPYPNIYRINDDIKNKINEYIKTVAEQRARINLNIPQGAIFQNSNVLEYNVIKTTTTKEHPPTRQEPYQSVEAIVNFSLKISVEFLTKKPIIINDRSLNFIFTYYQWSKFLKDNNYLENKTINLIPINLNEYKIQKINSLNLSGFFIKKINIKFKYSDSSFKSFENIELFDNDNESYTQTIINF
ncbi:hypothetical protein [[Mycoplasma] testudinis]|uniref:hypothetical protein n=1 Tax=[Mycoplasma] testudinis TaxID=33924 RepID=UPI0004860787|nr:hypothetical protein [[Mycoplasma] testudinis]